MKISDIKIDWLFFQFMKKGKELKGLRKGSTGKLDSKAHKAYATHISQVAIKPKSRSSYDIFEIPNESKKMKNKLDELRQLVMPGDKARLDTISQELAQNYREKERGNVPGVFFLVLFTSKGKRYVAILKLDWFSESWSTLDITMKMTLNEVVEELPGTGGFRKGAIYPHSSKPANAYMKIYQDDNPAAYFDEFLRGRPRVKARDMLQEMRELTRKATGDWPSYKQTLDLYQGLKDHVGPIDRMIDTPEVVAIMKAALPSHANKVKKVVEEHLGTRGEVKSSEISDLQLRLSVGPLRVIGTFDNLMDHFHPFHKKSKDKHLIEGEITQQELVKK